MTSLATSVKAIIIAAYLALVTYLIIRSGVIILQNYFTLPHWDQWEFFRAISTDPHRVSTLAFLFEPHGAHVILSGNLLSLLDYYLFNSTNLFLVGIISTGNLLLAWMLASSAFPEPLDKRRYLAFGAFAVAALSLSQWENLLWAFQTTFVLDFLLGFLSIYLATKLIIARRTTKNFIRDSGYYFLFTAALALTILSLANGMMIGISLVVVLVIYRQSATTWIRILFPWVVFTCFYFWLTRNITDVGDPSFRTLLNYLHFLTVMLGTPLSSSPSDAAIIGATLIVIFSGVMAWTIIVPWWRRLPVDPYLAKLTAFGCFLAASAAAITWGRVTLGVPFAVASRYSTPTLLFWMVTFASVARYTTVSAAPRHVYWNVANVMTTLSFIVAAISTLRPSNFVGIDDYSTRVRQAGYFIVSGVLSDQQLNWIYPAPSVIRTPIQFLREHRLNIFSDAFGLKLPADLAIAGALKEAKQCQLVGVDTTRRLDNYGWMFDGWVAHPTTKVAPDLVLAFDGQGRLRGFTKPLTHRPDVIAAIRTPTSFRGFSVPISPFTSSNARDPDDNTVSLVAVFSDGQSCRLGGEWTLPTARS